MPQRFVGARRGALSLVLSAIVALSAANALVAGELPFDEAQLRRTGGERARLAYDKDGPAALLSFDDPHWDAGLRVLPPDGAARWDLSAGRVLAVDVENLHPERQMRLTMHLVADNPADEQKTREAVGGIALNPGEKRPLRILLPHHNRYAAPAGVPGMRTLRTDRVHFIDFKMQWPFESARENIVNVRLSGLRLEDGVEDLVPPPGSDGYFPFIDAYGQYKHGAWKEKVEDDAELPRRRAEEEAQLQARPRPSSWNRFGGWADGPQLEATGSFRAQKHDGRWWLVDPEGKLFFSHGVDVLIAHTDSTSVKDRDHWFEEPEAAENGRLPFTHFNLRKKYGRPDYEEEFYPTLARRLQHWGMNTIGDWGKPELMALGQTPYTLQLSDYNWSLPRIQGSKLKFYDVFHPDYIRAMQTLIPDAAAKNPMVLPSLDDPMCIGYFIDNELNFGNRGRLVFPDDVLRAPAAQPAKKEWLVDLKLKYLNVDALNDAWGLELESWKDFLANENVPETPAYKEDALEFFRRAADQYFRLCREAVKTLAPHRLYLGTRFISTDAPRRELAEASAKYCDVLTVNIYAHGMADFANGADFPDMPVLVGEFHFGIYDRGMFSPGLCQAGVTQAERALAYTRFAQGALVNPRVVGVHWFQMRDQPLTGRGDGESYAIGFVDVTDTPYPEMVDAARAVGEHMYDYRVRGEAVGSMAR